MMDAMRATSSGEEPPRRLANRLRLVGVEVEPFRLAVTEVTRCLRRGCKLLTFGNGGSAADAQHIAAELVGRFERERPPLAAIALTTDSSLLTAIGNDFGFDQVFARQVEALGRRGDVVIAISTSGRSPNVLTGVRVARDLGLLTIALVGRGPSELEQLADIALVVSGSGSASIQESQLIVEHELCRAVESSLANHPAHVDPDPSSRIVDWGELQRDRMRWRTEDVRVVWTNGCFDLLHVGHVRSLEAAKALGDILVVGINSDRAVRELKGENRPLVPSLERAELVASLRPVDRVVIFDDVTPVAALDALRPDIHAKGADYADRPMPERSIVEGYGGRVVLLPLVEGVSTTEIVSRVSGRD